MIRMIISIILIIFDYNNNDKDNNINNNDKHNDNNNNRIKNQYNDNISDHNHIICYNNKIIPNNRNKCNANDNNNIILRAYAMPPSYRRGCGQVRCGRSWSEQAEAIT